MNAAERLHVAIDRRVVARTCHAPASIETRRLLAFQPNLPRRVNKTGVYSKPASIQEYTVSILMRDP